MPRKKFTMLGLLASLLILVLVSNGGAKASATPIAHKHTVVGVSVGGNLANETDDELMTTFAELKQTGVRWLRLDLNWAQVQAAGPDSYDWTLTDRIVSAARAHHLRILGVIAYTPNWARSSHCETSCPPARNIYYTRFARAVALRYENRIRAFEIWNEENHAPFWNTPNPRQYGKMLLSASRAIHHVSPKSRIAFGGLASSKNEGMDMDQGSFLRAACARNRCRFVNIVAYHPYTWPYLASDHTSFRTAWERIYVNTSYGPALLQAMHDRHLRVPIWITEFGAPTGGPGQGVSDETQQTEATDHVTESLQARIVNDGIRTARRSSHIGAIFIYTLQDSSFTNSNEDYYGLFRIDGSPKPALSLLSQIR